MTTDNKPPINSKSDLVKYINDKGMPSTIVLYDLISNDIMSFEEFSTLLKIKYPNESKDYLDVYVAWWKDLQKLQQEINNDKDDI